MLRDEARQRLLNDWKIIIFKTMHKTKPIASITVSIQRIPTSTARAKATAKEVDIRTTKKVCLFWRICLEWEHMIKVICLLTFCKIFKWSSHLIMSTIVSTLTLIPIMIQTIQTRLQLQFVCVYASNASISNIWKELDILQKLPSRPQ